MGLAGWAASFGFVELKLVGPPPLRRSEGKERYAEDDAGAPKCRLPSPSVPSLSELRDLLPARPSRGARDAVGHGQDIREDRLPSEEVPLIVQDGRLHLWRRRRIPVLGSSPGLPFRARGNSWSLPLSWLFKGAGAQRKAEALLSTDQSGNRWRETPARDEDELGV